MAALPPEVNLYEATILPNHARSLLSAEAENRRLVGVSVGSFFHFKPGARCRILAQSGPRRGCQFALHQTAGRLLDHIVGLGGDDRSGSDGAAKGDFLTDRVCADECPSHR